jgi:hypothetical protein
MPGACRNITKAIEDAAGSARPVARERILTLASLQGFHKNPEMALAAVDRALLIDPTAVAAQRLRLRVLEAMAH